LCERASARRRNGNRRCDALHPSSPPSRTIGSALTALKHCSRGPAPKPPPPSSTATQRDYSSESGDSLSRLSDLPPLPPQEAVPTMALTPFLGLDTGSLIDDPFLSPFSGSMSLFNPLRGASNMVRAWAREERERGGQRGREREGEGAMQSAAMQSLSLALRLSRLVRSMWTSRSGMTSSSCLATFRASARRTSTWKWRCGASPARRGADSRMR
jgi:hypothetical protein